MISLKANKKHPLLPKKLVDFIIDKYSVQDVIGLVGKKDLLETKYDEGWSSGGDYPHPPVVEMLVELVYDFSNVEKLPNEYEKINLFPMECVLFRRKKTKKLSIKEIKDIPYDQEARIKNDT